MLEFINKKSYALSDVPGFKNEANPEFKAVGAEESGLDELKKFILKRKTDKRLPPTNPDGFYSSRDNAVDQYSFEENPIGGYNMAPENVKFYFSTALKRARALKAAQKLSNLIKKGSIGKVAITIQRGSGYLVKYVAKEDWEFEDQVQVILKSTLSDEEKAKQIADRIKEIALTLPDSSAEIKQAEWETAEVDYSEIYKEIEYYNELKSLEIETSFSLNILNKTGERIDYERPGIPPSHPEDLNNLNLKKKKKLLKTPLVPSGDPKGTYEWMNQEAPDGPGAYSVDFQPYSQMVNSSVSCLNLLNKQAFYKNLTLQVSNLPKEVTSKIEEIQKTIPKDKLYVEEDEKGWVEDGLQKLFHITLLYGVEESDKAKIESIIKDAIAEGIVAKTEGIEYFDDEEDGYTAAVLRVDASKGLADLHEKLKDAVKNKNSYPTYKAHITIAYLKLGDRLDSVDFPEIEWPVKDIDMSTKEGKLVKVSHLKAFKQAVGYVEDGDGYSCKRCAAIGEKIEDKLHSCAFVKSKIHEDACCNLWTKKLPSEKTDFSVGQAYAGYIYCKDVSYFCKECLGFRDGKCILVEGDISPTGSCNLWIPTQDRVDRGDFTVSLSLGKEKKDVSSGCLNFINKKADLYKEVSETLVWGGSLTGQEWAVTFTGYFSGEKEGSDILYSLDKITIDGWLLNDKLVNKAEVPEEVRASLLESVGEFKEWDF